jgi:hypothetical protein
LSYRFGFSRSIYGALVELTEWNDRQKDGWWDFNFAESSIFSFSMTINKVIKELILYDFFVDTRYIKLI